VDAVGGVFDIGDFADETFATGGTEYGEVEGFEFCYFADELEVLLDGFAEAEAWVDCYL